MKRILPANTKKKTERIQSVSTERTEHSARSLRFPNMKRIKEIVPRTIGFYIFTLLGSAILAYGLYNIHAFADMTEGGVLGLTLFFYHFFDISPALSGFLMNTACYLFGMKHLGIGFLFRSFIAGGFFSVFYAVFEQFEPIFPQIGEFPFIASVIGGIFVGVGVGFCVLAGGAPSGDDALAMSISYLLHTDIQWIYLATDIIVLALSLLYIAPVRLIYSLLTVVISGQIIGLIQKISNIEKKENAKQ